MPRHAFVIFAGRTRYQVQRVMPFDPSILQLFITFLLISPSLSFLQQTRVTVPTFAVELMIIPFLLISLLLPVSFIDRLSTDRANRPLIVAFHVFVTSFRRSLSRYRPQTPPDDDLYLQFRRFRRNWRSRVQDARGFFLVGIVFGFLLWLWVWIFFCLLLDCLFFWFAFGCVWLLFLCVLFWLAFRFALFLVRISVLIAFPVCSVSVPEHGMQKAPRHSGKKRRGTQVQIVSRIDSPPPARPARYRSDGRPRIISDIGRSRGRPSIPPEDRFGPLGSEPAWPSAAAFLLLDRYRVQIIRNGSNPISDSMDGSFRYRSLKVHVIPMDHLIPYLVFDRYIGKWADPDIGSDKWSKLGLWLHSSDSSLFGPFDPWGKWSKWSWLIYSFEPIYR